MLGQLSELDRQRCEAGPLSEPPHMEIGMGWMLATQSLDVGKVNKLDHTLARKNGSPTQGVVFFYPRNVVFVVVFLWWCFCGGVLVVVFVLWCLCGGVLVVVFL